MQVLFIITKGDNIGGAQIYVLELAKRFSQNGFEVTVIVGSKGYLTDRLINAGINVVHINTLKTNISLLNDVITTYRIYKYLQKAKPNIVSLNSSKVGIVGRLACFLHRTPCIFTVHGWSFTDGIPKNKQFFFKTLERGLRNLCSGWIVVSQYDLELGIKSKAAIANKTYLIHNGVNILNDSSRTIPAFIDNNSPETINIIFTARHDHQKDHITLFKSIKNICNIKVYLLGDGPLINSNIQAAKQIGVFDKVNFIGFTNKVEHYLAMSHIFVLITNWEGFPISILEAMNYKLPVIASDICGNKEAVINNQTGFLVPPKDYKTLEEKLLILIENKNLREKMGEQGYHHLNESFNFNKVFNKTKDVFIKHGKY